LLFFAILPFSLFRSARKHRSERTIIYLHLLRSEALRCEA